MHLHLLSETKDHESFNWFRQAAPARNLISLPRVFIDTLLIPGGQLAQSARVEGSGDAVRKWPIDSERFAKDRWKNKPPGVEKGEVKLEHAKDQ